MYFLPIFAPKNHQNSDQNRSKIDQNREVEGKKAKSRPGKRPREAKKAKKNEKWRATSPVTIGRRHAGGQWGSRAGGFPENIENPSKILHADAPQWGAADSIDPHPPLEA